MREVPKYFDDKRDHWRELSRLWFGRHNKLGIALMVLYTIMAALGGAAPWPELRWRIVATILPVVAAALSFLMGTYASRAKGTAFELAMREIEKAEALYRTNYSLPDSSLGEAEARGIQLLCVFKLN
jgi:hypothetical protein